MLPLSRQRFVVRDETKGALNAAGITAWQLVQEISPRAHVRVAATNPDGTVAAENAYPHRANIAGTDPGLPFVVHLADDDGAFHLIAFDFDAHHSPSVAARNDAFALVALMERLGGLDPLICESGPSGGMHVWLATKTAVPAPVVAALARAAARNYTTLGIEPLVNPTTGGVRPPGAPHRHGGHSAVVLGSIDTLLKPSTTVAALVQLTAALEAAAPSPETTEPGDSLALVDQRGRLYLPGQKTTLGTSSAAALHNPLAPGADASSVLFSALLGAARARWRYDDVRALLDTAPGLEHARTVSAGARRTPRTPAEQDRRLAYQWDRAVRHAAATKLTATGQSSPELTERARVTTAVIERALARMRSCPGRWGVGNDGSVPRRARNQRATDRLVLLELLRRANDALTTEVRASIRTLAMSLPVGRESVRTSLQRLAKDGFISLVATADGEAATTWTIDPSRVFHKEVETSRSAVGLAPTESTPPNLSPWHARSAVGHALRTTTTLAAHDTFLCNALGPQAGYLYGQLALNAHSTASQLARASGTDPAETQTALDRLASAGLALLRNGTWTAAAPESRDRAAQLHGVTGVRQARQHQYKLEQATWAYWVAELESTRRAIAFGRGNQRMVKLSDGRVLALAPYPRNGRKHSAWREARDRIVISSAA